MMNNIHISTMIQGQWEEVIYHCNETLELRPDFVKAFSRRARAYEAQDKVQEALDGLLRVLGLSGLLNRLYFRRRARAYEAQDKVQEALDGSDSGYSGYSGC